MMRSVSLSRRVARLASPLVVLAPALLAQAPAQTVAQTKPTIAQFLSPASPLEVTSARKADRIAWMTYERGMRNLYTAAAPDFKSWLS